MSFLLVLDPIFQNHVCPNLFHPECPGRVVSIERELAKMVPLDEFTRVPVREATAHELGRVHTAAYVNTITQTVTSEPFGYLDPQTYWDKNTLTVAKSAVGTTIDLATAIGDHQNPASRGVAVVRPPGHHARPSQAMGFCIFNTIACAAAALLDEGVGRVAVVDVDFHHGNGTQEAFYDRSDLLFLSLHERETFPGTGLATERGTKAGEGFTLNAVLEPQAGDDDLLAVVDQLFAPALRRFRPHIILVSAGFDAHEKDRLGNMNATREGFSRIFTRLRALAHALCEGRILAVLEGGYHHEATATACADLILAWSKEGYVRYPEEQLSPKESTCALIEEQQQAFGLSRS